MSSAAKIGLFMLIILGVIGYFLLKIEDVDLSRGKATRQVKAIFDNVAGLDEKSAVRVAGVRKGKVSKIRLLPNGKAEVTLDIDNDVPLYGNASAQVANLGLLGEKYIELSPGSPNVPATSTATTVTLQGTSPATIDQVTNQVSAIATDVKAITESLRHAVGGPTGEKRLDEIVENIREITAQTRELIAANRENVDATVTNMRAITADLRTEIPKLAASIDRVANQIGGTVGENRADVHQVVENLRGLSSDLRVTANNLNDITGQVKSGQGTVGKLIYDQEAYNRLNSSLASVESGVNELKNVLGRANRIGLGLGLKGEYLSSLPKPETGQSYLSHTRSAVQVTLVPNIQHNRFFNIELADDPRGRKRENDTITTVTNPDTGQSVTTVTHQTRFDNDYRLSVQGGWLLDNLAVRVGLFDNTGGGGVDWQYNTRLRLTGEAFDFGQRYDPHPHVKVFGEYTIRQEKTKTPRVFVSAGVDNPFNRTAVTFGGGIRWSDDDLKYLLGSIPIPK